MSDDPYNVCYLTTKLPPDFVSQVCECAKTYGFTPKDSDENFVSLRYDEITEVSIDLNRGEKWDWNEPHILVSLWTMPLQTHVDINPAQHTRQKVQNRVQAIIDLLVKLVVLTEPEYVWSRLAVGTHYDEELRPMDRPITDNISKMSWFTVFSESVVEQLGGRERVLEAPAWRIDALETGHIVIIRANNPTDPTEKPDTSPATYLLEESDSQSSDPESTDLSLVDPFAAP